MIKVSKILAPSTCSHDASFHLFVCLTRLIDRNGRIDRKEMEKLVIAIYDLNGVKNRKGENAPKERVNAIFRKLDSNYTNMIDCEEFVNGCLRDPVLMRFFDPTTSQTLPVQ